MKKSIFLIIFLMISLTAHSLEDRLSNINYINYQLETNNNHNLLVEKDSSSFTSNKIVLEPNIIENKNVLSQGMIAAKNRKYVIKYDYDLKGCKIYLPENCVLEFDGGSFNNGTVDFTNCKHNVIYSSWMDTETLLNSIHTMSYKTLVIDTILELNKPISNKNSDNHLFYFTIRGLEENDHKWDESNYKNHSRIICNNCPAVDITGWCNVVKDLSFSFKSGGKDNPFITLDTQGEGVSDLDCTVDGCYFDTTDRTNPSTFSDLIINNAIVFYGRGVKVTDCLFRGSVKDAYVKCCMKSDTWRLKPSIDVSDKYGGRAFWIHDNRIHAGISRLVHFAVNANAPHCVFRGIRIENNVADIGGSLGLFDAPSYNTVITNNTFLGGTHPNIEFLTFTDANELKIDNNVFRAYDNSDIHKTGLCSNYCITIHSSEYVEIRNVSICHNLSSSNAYFIFVDTPIKGLIIDGNMFNDQAFSSTNCAILRSLKTTKNVVIKNNVNNSMIKNDVECFRAFDISFPNENLENIIIGDNIGCINWVTSFGQYDRLLKGRTFTNINIKYDRCVSPEEVMDACSLIVNVKSKIGFSFVDTQRTPSRLLYWNGSKWADALGR